MAVGLDDSFNFRIKVDIMRVTKSATAALCAVVMFAGLSHAGLLEKRHQVELRLGAWNQVTDNRTEITATGVTTTVGSSGFLGGFAYSYWLTEGTALNISIGFMAVDLTTDASIAGVTSKNSTVTPILMGVKQYFPRSTYGTSVRPYVKAAIGPYLGHQSLTLVDSYVTIESRSRAAFGGILGGGVDFVIGRHFATGMAIGYNLMTDFDKPIGGSINYSGPEFSFGFSYLFGRGVD